MAVTVAARSGSRPDPVAPPDGSAARRRAPRILDPKSNSLNLIRLALAIAVLFSHSFPLSGRTEPIWAEHSLGSWAVLGFFAISGYLITGARLRSDMGRYLMNRIARIFPGYLACLVVVAFVLAPVAFVVEKGTINGFLTTPNTPLNYVFANAFLRIPDYSVAGTLATVPYRAAWNGSAWTLYYEFFCYLIVGAAAIVPLVRRSAWPLVGMFAASVLVYAKIDAVESYLGGNGEFRLLMYLLPYFLGGAVLFVLKDRAPLRWYIAAAAVAVSVPVIAAAPDWGGQLCAPLLAYALIWLGAALPSPRFVQIHDLSYGVYVYAWPVTQMLVLFGVHRHGLVVLDLVVVAVTTTAAAASWFLVERPAKRLASAARRLGPAATPVENRDRRPQPVLDDPPSCDTAAVGRVAAGHHRLVPAQTRRPRQGGDAHPAAARLRPGGRAPEFPAPRRPRLDGSAELA